MVRYLTYKEIDREKWDRCIASSLLPLPCALSWWLDIVSPNWEALVQDDYRAVMPLTQRRRYFIRYLVQPYFSQQLGIFSADVTGESVTAEFLKHIPHKFRYIHIQLNSGNICNTNGYRVKSRSNFILDLLPVYHDITTNYHRNCSRNIKIAKEAGLRTEEITDTLVFLTFIQTQLKQELKNVKSHFYTCLKDLISTSFENNSGKITGVYNNNQLLACAWHVLYKNRFNFLVCASTPVGRENNAMYLLVDHLISQYAGSEILFDFSGSDMPGVAYFNKGFGSIMQNYYSLYKNSLPWPINKIRR